MAASTPCSSRSRSARQPRPARRQLGPRQFRRAAEADDAGHVLGAGAPPAFLPAAAQQRRELHAAAHIQRADALGRMQLVSGQRQHVDAGRLHVDGEFPDRLHRVGVKQRPRRVGQRRQLGDGKIVPVSLLAHMIEATAVRGPSARR